MSTYVSHLHMVIIGSKQEELCKLEPPGMCSESIVLQARSATRTRKRVAVFVNWGSAGSREMLRGGLNSSFWGLDCRLPLRYRV